MNVITIGIPVSTAACTTPMAVASVGRREHRDPVGAGCGEGVDLCSVVCGRIGRHEQLIGAVPIAARTQVPLTISSTPSNSRPSSRRNQWHRG
ncbi:MAG: hypothetical protein M3144_06520 [Actinomycetota bacterium]|nr:hypothetical protein [Actinomycetota bacterium]